MKDALRDYYIQIGIRIAMLRRAKGLTQIDLADMTGKDHKHISKIERAHIGMSLDTFLEIAEVLEVDPRELLNFADIERITK